MEIKKPEGLKQNGKRAIGLKRFIGYLLYTLLLIFLVIKGSQYAYTLRVLTGRTLSPLPSMVFTTVYPIVFGMILGLPHAIGHWRKPGVWKIDWTRMLAIGIPCLLTNLSLLLFFFSPISKLMGRFAHVLAALTDVQVATISGLILGYVILTSIQKTRDA